VIGAAVAVGPVIGGVITSGIGWEWIFFVNVPIGVMAVLLTLSQVGESRDPDAAGVDWAGLVTFSGSLFLLVFALVQGNDLGWGSTRIVAYLTGSALLIVLFVIAERRQRRPMLDLSLFRRPAFAGASIVAFAISASMFAMFLYLTLYIQDVLGYTPLQAGLRFLPVTLLSFFVAPLSGRLSVRVPVRLLLGSGMLLVSAGLLAMTAIEPSSGWTTLIPGFLLAGAGIGLVNPPLASTAIGVVHVSRSGMASGINNTFRQVGIATGIAGLGAVFQHEVTSNTTAALASSAPGRQVLAATHAHLSGALVSGGVSGAARSLPPAARAALAHSYRSGFTSALTSILVIGSGIALAGSLLGFALVRSRDFVASTEAPEQADAAAGEPLHVPAG
jgi:predicted MFS family arabinose efflux permease